MASKPDSAPAVLLALEFAAHKHRDQRRKDASASPYINHPIALVKLADKTCNLRDVAHRPPASWPLARRRQYFDWARAVVDALPPVSRKLRRAFDAAHALRP
jgi:guanosine-3',5'-bis(diphosphate) 3'-pyrophosphohydrolase